MQSCRVLDARTEEDRRRLLRLTWTYWLLLLTEGALRKWVLPELSDALLVVRDPVAIAIVVLGIRSGYLPLNGPTRVLVPLAWAFAALGAVQLLVLDDSSIFVLGYGLRTYFLHLPVAFVMAHALNHRDLRQIAIAALMFAIPMAMLMVGQFEAEGTAWLNRAVGGHGAMQITSAAGRIRPAATFSFISGPIAFFSIVFAVLLASHVELRGISWFVRVGGWFALAFAAAVSGSRSLLGGVLLVLLAAVIGGCRRPAIAGRLLVAAITAALVINVVATFDTAQEGAEVLRFRAEDTNDGGIAGRMLVHYRAVVWAFADAPLLGRGIGSGTNAGSSLGGSTDRFELGEGEWSRVLFEAGPLVGILYLGVRIWLTLAIARAALRAASAGALFPIALFGACASSWLMGQWGQPTTQGFAVFTAGLSLAAARCAMLATFDLTPADRVRWRPWWPVPAEARR
jgi:hypothetical protein